MPGFRQLKNIEHWAGCQRTFDPAPKIIAHYLMDDYYPITEDFE